MSSSAWTGSILLALGSLFDKTWSYGPFVSPSLDASPFVNNPIPQGQDEFPEATVSLTTQEEQDVPHPIAPTNISAPNAQNPIQAMHNAGKQHSPQIPPHPLPTPVNPLKVRELFHSHPDAQYLSDGFSKGFLLHFDGEESSFTAHNSFSAKANPQVVRNKINQELALNRIAGPFEHPPFPHFKSSPLALREKQQPGKFRLLHNLSYPYDSTAVNSNISKEHSTVKYQTLRDAISLILKNSPQAYIAKSDIADAFRLIPLHPSQYHLTGFFFEGFYYDRCLPMGCSSSCQIFETFSSAIKWVLQTKLAVPNVVKVLDDFFFVGKTEADCRHALDQFTKLCSELGVPLAPHKTVGPTTSLTFLGVELDSFEMQARLPLEKLQTYTRDLQELLTHKKVTLRNLKSTIGKLEFSTAVIPSGKPFLRRLHDLTIGVSKPFYFVRLTNAVKLDLTTWLSFLENYNGRTLLSFRPIQSSNSLHLYSDASKAGFGATYGSKWIQSTWPNSWTSLNIAVLELFPIYVLTSMFAQHLTNTSVIFHCDNQAVVEILNKQSSKCPKLMSIIRPFVLVLLHNNISFRAEHIPGLQNNLCDAISRLQVSPQLLARHRMQPNPMKIPAHLLPDNFTLTSSS